MPDEARHGCRVSALALLGLVVSLVLGPAGAMPAAARDDGPVDLGLYGAPIRFEAPQGVVMELDSGRRLVDTLELRPSPVGDGMVVVAEMGLDQYVAGIAEMPGRWPMEALKAQAVASRTYAWYQASLRTYRERGLPYDICATTACQVFEGHAVVETPAVGARWQRAVERTAGEVLLYEGEPILARYFSTSGGRTRNNEDVFPSSGAYPYLKGIDDPDDEVSPMHAWKVRFTRAQFDDLLSRGETLSTVVPVADARVVQVDGGDPDRVVVTGRDGSTAEVTAGQLRDFLDDVAPAVFPDQFPGPRRDGGRLPSTVPSTRYTIDVRDDHVVLDGSGWGHGVGMGQYGAKGKAERGLSHVEILETYYTGVTPTTTPAAPDRIRVGLADDLDQLAVTAEGPVTVRAGDTVLTERGFGTWRLRGAADDTTRVQAPPGHGAPLVAEPTTTSRNAPYAVEAVVLETVVNKPAELVVEVRADAGEVVGRRSMGVVDRGRRRTTWRIDTDEGSLAPGRYEVALVAVDEDGTEAGSAVPIEVAPVEGGTMRGVLADRAPVRAPGTGTPVVPAVLAALIGMGVGASVRHRVEVRP